MATKKQQAEQQEAIENLRTSVPPGTTVYTLLRHVSRSGMYRAIDLYIIADPDEYRNAPYLNRITYTAAVAMGARYDRKHEALGVGGCGMDMLWHTVYNLGWALHSDGYALQNRSI